MTDAQKLDLLIGIIILVLIVIFKEFIILLLIPIAIYMYEYSINFKDLLQLLRDKALVLFEREMLIVSPWMNYHVLVETNVKNLLRRALERKVKIKIVYGIGSDLSANSG